MKSLMKQFQQWQNELRMTLESPMKQFQQQQNELRMALESPMKQFQQQQNELHMALESPMKQFQQQQNELRMALESPMKQIQQQQNELRMALESPMKQIQQQQNGLRMALESPMKQFQQQQNELRMALESPIKQFQQQQNELSNIISATFMKAYKVNSFSIDGGITVLDNIIEDLQGNSNSATFLTQDKLDLSVILNDFIESYLKLASQFKNGYNAITNNKVLLQLTALIGLISSILTIVSFVQGDSIDIQIHNNFEDVKIDTETKGKKVDIYIEEKELPVEPNIRKEDNWMSGGERI